MLASVWTNCEEIQPNPQPLVSISLTDSKINMTNAIIFRSVGVEVTLSGHDSCHLKCNYCPQAAVAPVMHIQVYFT